MHLTVQRLTPAHAVAYRALMLEAYSLHPEAFTSAVSEREALPVDWWEKRLDNGSAAADVVFGALDGSALLGVVGLALDRRMKARHKSTLFGMYVAPAHRHTGIAHELMLRVLAYARSQPQLLVVQLTVTEGNQGAQGLYEQMGFTSFGTEPMAVAVGSHFVSKVHMWHALRRV